MANFLSSVSPTLLPPTITEPIFTKATESSAVQQLARKVPLSITAQTAIPVMMDVPAAGWVTEGGVKPTGGETIGIKTMTGKKVALLLPISEEVATTNAAGLYDQLQQDLPTAIARAFDHAAIVGKDLRTGSAGPFSDYLSETSQTVVLGTATQAHGSHYADLVAGEQDVTNKGYDFTGFAADPRLKPQLKLDTDTTGRPLWIDSPADGIGAGTLIGYPAFFNRGVSGLYRRGGNKVQVITENGTPTGGTFTLSVEGQTTTAIAQAAAASAVQTALRALANTSATTVTVTGSNGGPFTATFTNDGGSAPITANGANLTGGTSPTVTVIQATTVDSGIRAIGGDFSQCAYGVGRDITIKVSTQASYVDEGGTTHSAFQENLVLLLVEAYYGFVVGDPNAFVTYTGTN